MTNELDTIIKEFNQNLNDKLLSSDIWVKESKLSIASYNSNQQFIELFGNHIATMELDLDKIGYPDLGAFQIITLKLDTLLVILNTKDYLWGSLIDNSKLTYDRLINKVIPDAINSFEKLM